MADTKTAMLALHPAPWCVVPAGLPVQMDCESTFPHPAEDDCIVDANGVEVLGTSEWLRGTEHLQAIVDCVNSCAEAKEQAPCP